MVSIPSASESKRRGLDMRKIDVGGNGSQNGGGNIALDENAIAVVQRRIRTARLSCEAPENLTLDTHHRSQFIYQFIPSPP
jgi:hypothetical protein